MCGCWVQYEISAAALEALQSTTDAKGRKLEVYKVPLPPNLFITQEEADGLTVSSSPLLPFFNRHQCLGPSACHYQALRRLSPTLW